VNYKVEEVVGSREWGGPPNGPFIDYTLALEGVPEQVSLNQKQGTPAPVAGQELDLTLEDFPAEQVAKVSRLANMKKAKKVPQGGGGWGGGGGGSRTDDPKTSRSIAKQHSNRLAWEMAAFATEHNLDEETIARMTGLQSRFSAALYASVMKAQEGDC
jgi:hypothetical protein